MDPYPRLMDIWEQIVRHNNVVGTFGAEGAIEAEEDCNRRSSQSVRFAMARGRWLAPRHESMHCLDTGF